MDKKSLLVNLYREMEQNTALPLRAKPEDIVPGEGNSDAKVIFIGEAAGFNEARLRRPFVGQAGHLLDQNLERIGLKREEVYITNIVKARPPENRDPTFAEIISYKNYLEREIEIIDPAIIVTLGRHSLGKFKSGVKISEVHGRFFKTNGKILFPLFHPAAALRGEGVKNLFEKDFDTLAEYLKNPNSIEVEDTVSKEENPAQERLF